MNTPVTTSESEIALIQANTLPVEGKVLHWLLSRKQVIYILREIKESAAAGVHGPFPMAPYLEELLPVVDLEAYYGLQSSGDRKGAHYVVTRTAKADTTMGKAIIRSVYPVRVRKLNFSAESLEETGLRENVEDILGAFTLDGGDIVIIPDLAAVIAKNQPGG